MKPIIFTAIIPNSVIISHNLKINIVVNADRENYHSLSKNYTSLKI